MSPITYDLPKDAVRESDTEPMNTVVEIGGVLVELDPEATERLFHSLELTMPNRCPDCDGTGHRDHARITGCRNCKDTGWVK